MFVYCLYDKVSRMALSPFVAENDIVVSRMLRSEVARADTNSNLVNYPEDFEIRCLGTWKPEDAHMFSYDDARVLGTVADLAPRERGGAPSTDNYVRSPEDVHALGGA